MEIKELLQKLKSLEKQCAKAIREGSHDKDLLIDIFNQAVELKKQFPGLPPLPIMNSIPSLARAQENQN